MHSLCHSISSRLGICESRPEQPPSKVPIEACDAGSSLYFCSDDSCETTHAGSLTSLNSKRTASRTGRRTNGRGDSTDSAGINALTQTESYARMRFRPLEPKLTSHSCDASPSITIESLAVDLPEKRAGCDLFTQVNSHETGAHPSYQRMAGLALFLCWAFPDLLSSVVRLLAFV